MRPRTLSNVLAVVTAGSLVTASPAGHKHHGHPHPVEKREAENVKTVKVPGPTIVAYKLNGNLIDENDVCQGIDDGSLSLVGGKELPPKCPAVDSKSTGSHTASASVVSTSIEKVTTGPRPTSEQKGYEAPKLATKPAATHLASAASTMLPNVDAVDRPVLAPISTGEGLDENFPDGAIDCSTFPSKYGPIKVDWAQLDGWSGIQYVTFDGNHIDHIETALPNGKGCKPGAMCSYACPPGYQKSQWPSAQGSTGQSIGGLRCGADGKLRLTNSNLSRKLCVPGTGATVVENKLSNNAAICRTDYPGTENEVVPLNTQPDTTSPLTCPDAGTYFKHRGSPTSAQYYINNQGIPVQKACIWGSDGTNMGNWAPSYLGVGQDTHGKTFLAIASTAQNQPTNYKPLNYTIEITGHTSGNCRLKNGKYCSGSNFDNCNDKGCTVELLSGKATYVLSDD